VSVARSISWQDGQHWLGYFEEYPDYVTQGESLEDLQVSLQDLLADLTSGAIPGIRRSADLMLPPGGET
jgi:predicted RNase H-like HicB family nuclease